MEILNLIAESTDSQMIALLLGIVVTFSGVIVYMYKHTQNQTVPKYIWKELVGNIVNKITSMNKEIREIKSEIQDLRTIMNERL